MKWVIEALVAAVLIAAPISQSRAGIEVACVADDIYMVSYRGALETLKKAEPSIPEYAKLNGSQLVDPQSRFRFADGKVYWKQPDQDEYLYGELTKIFPTRFQSGSSNDMTVIFDDKFETAIITVVSSIQTTVYSTKCISG
jgi:hypothetical protein